MKFNTFIISLTAFVLLNMNLSQFINDKKKKKIFLVLLVFSILIILFFVFLLYSFNSIYNFSKSFILNDKSPLGIFLVENGNKFFKGLDEINIFRLKKNLLDGTLPIYSLKLSRKDLRAIDQVSQTSIIKGYLPSEINGWRKAELTVDGKKYEIKIKLHGDMPTHWAYNLKSYSIKITSPEAINGIQTFNLILFEDRHLTGMMTKVLAQDLGLFNIRDDIVTLKINGVVQGLYYLQEDLGIDFLENNRCSSCIIFKTTDNWAEDHPRADYTDLNGITDGQDHGTDFDNEISNINLKLEKNIFNKKALFIFNRLFEAVEKEDVQEVSSFFDPDQLSSFEALRWLVGSDHFVKGDNLRIIYQASTSKFYPVPLNEDLELLKLENGGVEHYLNDQVPLFKVLAQNEEIRHLRYQKLYNYVITHDLLTEIDKLILKYQPYGLSYDTNIVSSFYIKSRLRKDRDTLAQNIETIKHNLEYSKSYLNVFQKDNTLKIEVIPDSIAEIKFDKLIVHLTAPYSGQVSFRYVLDNITVKEEGQILSSEQNSLDFTSFTKNFFFSAALDPELYPRKRIYTLEFVFEKGTVINVDKAEVNMSNDITQKQINPEDLYIQIGEANNYLDGSQSLSFTEFKQRYPFLKWSYENDVLTLLNGNYVLTENLIVPSFSKFEIEAGTNLALGKGISVVSYSPVEIKGTKQNPVTVTAINPNKPFGTFGIIGEKEGTVSIDWLDLSGGNETVINGIYFSGGLSIYNLPTVKLTNSKIHNNHADDGLNIKYAEILVDNNQFYDNFADQFDCDFCTGVVKNSVFKDLENGDDNGDGLDFSGSTVLVKQNKFSQFQDKGLSVGEDTDVLVSGNIFTGNGIGFAAKDRSNVFAFWNQFMNNKVAISSYQKKPLFGGGFSYSYENQFQSNGQDYKKDNLSNNYQLKLTLVSKNKILKEIEEENIQKIFDSLNLYIALKEEKS